MNLVRIWGDPFDDEGPARALRAFLRVCLGGGMRCALSLTAVTPRPAPAAGGEVTLTDGVRELRVGTRLPADELEMLLHAAARPVAATAPVVVFAAAERLADAARLAGLEWPLACKVIAVRADQSPAALLERLRAELRWAGAEDPAVGCAEAELRPWLALPVTRGAGPIVHVARDVFADGTDLVVRAFAGRLAAEGGRLRVVLVGEAREQEAALRALAAGAAPAGVDAAAAVAFVCGTPDPGVVADAAAIVQPCRQCARPEDLVPLLASGRPLVLSRWSATARLVPRPGLCAPVGGRLVPPEHGLPARFEPDLRAITAEVSNLLGAPAASAAMAVRARRHVVEELTDDRPAPPPARPAAPRNGRPLVVLEAPFLETSSSAELSLQTARALQRRGRVDLRLVPVAPFRHDLPALRARAPELVDLLARQPRGADLWLAAGWPPRAHRPDCRTFAVRLDWEYGALPVELTPLVPQEADLVIVHSRHVFRTIAAAGRPADRIQRIAHGVDEAMREDAPALREVLRFKGDRPAVLFCGGPIWRKGMDLFLRIALQVARAGVPLCVVVKTVGQDQHYGGFHLGGLLDRFGRTAGAPPLLRIDRDLSRAELAGLYTACDVLLHPYRGEGFGLPVLEARACGLPVLVTGGGATDDFADGPGLLRIAAARRPLDLPGVHVSQPWALEPDTDEATRLLIGCLGELDAVRAAARGHAPTVRSAHGWDAAAEAIERLAFQAMAGAGAVAAAAPAATEREVTLPGIPTVGSRQPEPVG